MKQNCTEMNPGQRRSASTLDVEYERLLYIQKAVEPLIQRAAHFLTAEFPNSALAMKTFAAAFEDELATNLLAIYDRAPPSAKPVASELGLSRPNRRARV